MRWENIILHDFTTQLHKLPVVLIDSDLFQMSTAIRYFLHKGLKVECFYSVYSWICLHRPVLILFICLSSHLSFPLVSKNANVELISDEVGAKYTHSFLFWTFANIFFLSVPILPSWYLTYSPWNRSMVRTVDLFLASLHLGFLVMKTGKFNMFQSLSWTAVDLSQAQPPWPSATVVASSEPTQWPNLSMRRSHSGLHST